MRMSTVKEKGQLATGDATRVCGQRTGWGVLWQNQRIPLVGEDALLHHDVFRSEVGIGMNCLEGEERAAVGVGRGSGCVAVKDVDLWGMVKSEETRHAQSEPRALTLHLLLARLAVELVRADACALLKLDSSKQQVNNWC